MTCIKMGSDESHFNVSLIVRDKVTRQCPQTTTNPGWMRLMLRACRALGCFRSLISTQPFGGRWPRRWTCSYGEIKCPFSGVTKCGRVWRKVPESGAGSVLLAVSPLITGTDNMSALTLKLASRKCRSTGGSAWRVTNTD